MVAFSGVTACDHAMKAAIAIPIPIVPVENNSLNMIASSVLVDAAIMSQLRFRTLPSYPEIDVVQPRSLFRRNRQASELISVQTVLCSSSVVQSSDGRNWFGFFRVSYVVRRRKCRSFTLK